MRWFRYSISLLLLFLLAEHSFAQQGSLRVKDFLVKPQSKDSVSIFFDINQPELLWKIKVSLSDMPGKMEMSGVKEGPLIRFSGGSSWSVKNKSISGRMYLPELLRSDSLHIKVLIRDKKGNYHLHQEQIPIITQL